MHINLRVNSKQTLWTHWTLNMYNLWPTIWFKLTDKRPDRPEVISLHVSGKIEGEEEDRRNKKQNLFETIKSLFEENASMIT